MIAARVASGRWVRATSGVYLISGTPRTFEQRVMVAALAGGPGTLASHRTALRLWGIGGSRSTPVEVSSPRPRHHDKGRWIRHRSRDLHLADPTTIDGIPVTGLGRTLLDIGAVEPPLVLPAVREAMRHHTLTWDELVRTLVQHAKRGRPGIGPLRRVVASHLEEEIGDSATEDLAFDLIVRSGLVPRPRRLVPVTCADGVRVTVDLGWPEHRCFVELYGIDHLTRTDRQHLDHHRINQIRLAGHHVLVYTGHMLRRQPDQFVSDVCTMLHRAGDPTIPS